jgi:UPF0271 protein
MGDQPPGIARLAPALSPLAAAGKAAGLKVVQEIFADRAYLYDSELVPRSRPDAMIHGAEAASAHGEAMLTEGAIVCASGKRCRPRSAPSASMATGRTR